MKRIWILIPVAVVIVAIAVPLIWRVDSVSGFVKDTNGQAISGAMVRIKATATSAITDATGYFRLTGFAPSFRPHITAWKDGYYVSGSVAWPWRNAVEIELASHVGPDNSDYTWIPPAIEDRSEASEWFIQTGLAVVQNVPIKKLAEAVTGNLELGCRDCHGQGVYKQWVGGAHALGTQNTRFMTMYNGTNVDGNRSPLTQFIVHKDYGPIPLRPDPAKPYYGPGFKLDFPDRAGNCATCHVPTLAIDNPYGSDPNQATGISEQGSHCDFCHKIASVNLDPNTGLPHENMPGIMSIELMRPTAEQQLFFGPYDDVDVGPDTFLPLEKQSEFCSPCHQASFWGVPIYQSFSEWLASPYPEEGTTCQSCHMKPDEITTNFAPGRGGLERDANTIPTHDFPGASDVSLLQNTADVILVAERERDDILVEVSVTNTEGGHHIPTDSPLRQILLVVTATDQQGRMLSLRSGPVLPDWTGDLAGKPGVYFAKVLEQLWTEISPTGAYWTQTRVLEDTRLPARETQTSQYIFSTPQRGEVKVEARLIFRRAFYDLMKQKGWEVPDILMEKETVTIPAE
ncbi:MAG: carboxypeptidase regulatory-like domain-containing protein [Dehalococcoidales bacterium]